MRRYQLFEFEDLNWLPTSIRNYQTDVLDAMAVRLGSVRTIAGVLSDLLERTSHRRIVDFGSGGGGGLLDVYERLRARWPELHITATDLNPNRAAAARLAVASRGKIDYLATPVDASAVPPGVTGIRTLLRIFHHLPPPTTKAVVEDAVRAGAPLVVLEFQERRIRDLIAMAVGTPLYTWLVTPSIRPLRFSRLLFTYVVPLIPMLVTWDGVVSALRTYSLAELRAMADDADVAHKFTWKIGRIEAEPMATTYLIGVPRSSGALSD